MLTIDFLRNDKGPSNPRLVDSHAVIPIPVRRLPLLKRASLIPGVSAVGGDWGSGICGAEQKVPISSD